MLNFQNLIHAIEQVTRYNPDKGMPGQIWTWLNEISQRHAGQGHTTQRTLIQKRPGQHGTQKARSTSYQNFHRMFYQEVLNCLRSTSIASSDSGAALHALRNHNFAVSSSSSSVAMALESESFQT